MESCGNCGKFAKYVMHTKIPNVRQRQTPTNRSRYRMLKQIPKKRTQFTNKHVARVLQATVVILINHAASHDISVGERVKIIGKT